MAEYTRGSTTDVNSPPAQYGDATAVNDMVPPSPAVQPAEGRPAPSEFDQPEVLPGISGKPAGPIPTPSSDNPDRAWLLRPSERPNEPVTYGMQPNGRLNPPPDLGEWIGDLQQAAKMPDAPAQVRLLYDLVAASLEG